MIGMDGCGIEDAGEAVRHEDQDKLRVAMAPPATLRCETAEAVATLGARRCGANRRVARRAARRHREIAAYECRGRNRIVGAKISEHGKGNALDIRALTLSNGKRYEPTDMAVSKDARERLKASVCARFSHCARPGLGRISREPYPHRYRGPPRRHRICQWAGAGRPPTDPAAARAAARSTAARALTTQDPLPHRARTMAHDHFFDRAGRYAARATAVGPARHDRVGRRRRHCGWFLVQFAVVIVFIAWRDGDGARLGRSGQASHMTASCLPS